MEKAVEKLGEKFAGNAFFLCGSGVLLTFLSISDFSFFFGKRAKAHEIIGKASFNYPIDGESLLNVAFLISK